MLFQFGFGKRRRIITVHVKKITEDHTGLRIFDGFDEAPIIVRFDLECFQELFNIRILTAAVIDTLLNALNRLDNLVVVRFQESDVKGYDPGAGTGKFLNQLDEF